MKKLQNWINNKMISTQLKMAEVKNSNKGEGYVDTIIKMAIAVIIGAIIITVLVAIIGNESDGMLGILKERLSELFNRTA